MFKVAQFVSMLCAPVFIFTSGSSALLGRPRCGLSIWLSLLAIFNTLFLSLRRFFFHEKTEKTRKYSKADIFEWYENGRRRLLGEVKWRRSEVETAPSSLYFRPFKLSIIKNGKEICSQISIVTLLHNECSTVQKRSFELYFKCRIHSCAYSSF